MYSKEASSRTAAGVDLFTEDLLTGGLIKHFCLNEQEDRKALIKLLGSDGQRIGSGIALTNISAVFENPEKELTPTFVARLNNLSKKEACRIYALFPRFILPVELFPDCEEERQEFKEMAFVNLSTALWLLDWNSQGRCSALLSRLGIKGTEKRAFVSEKLYSLCAYMKIHSKDEYIQTFSVPALWLMIEVSKCLNGLGEKTKGVSKSKRYKRRQNTFSALNDAVAGNSGEALSTRQARDSKDLLENFYRYFMNKAKEIASEQPDFDKILFSDYVKAEKTWGRSARDSKGVIGYL